MKDREERENCLSQLVSPLLWWYDENRRILPWREDATPYRVWVSEIMLQQTRVEAGRGYFERFVKELPHVEALANVPDQRLMKLWEGLGYYNRASNLKKAAGIIMEKYSGKMPDTLEGLLSLPGIGSYTAGAIGSIAFGLSVAAVDGNVLRVLSRIEADDRDILSAAVKKDREQALAQVMPADRPGDFNQALMELGAIICVPNGEPKCSQCPVVNLCQAFAQGIISQLPVKKAKKERRIEKKTMLLLVKDQRVALQKRPAQGLLRGQWELPWLEGYVTGAELQQQMGLNKEAPQQVKITELGEVKHVFSHVEWQMTGCRVDITDDLSGSTKDEADMNQMLELLAGERPLQWVTREELEHQVALPTAYKFYRDRF